MRLLMLIGGVSGSGKTGVAEFLTANLMQKCKRYSADDFFMRNGSYTFQPELLSEAHNQCKRNIENNMEVDWPVLIVDNTFTTKDEAQWYIDKGKEYGYHTIYLAVVNHHGNKNNHKVPFSTIKVQTDRLCKTIKSLSEKPYEDLYNIDKE